MTVLSKAQFARAVNVGKSRVTAYLKTKLIDGDAVVGEGRFAKIDLEKARAQLRDKLSTDHRFGLQGLNTKLDDPPRRGAVVADDDDILIDVDIALAQLRERLTVGEIGSNDVLMSLLRPEIQARNQTSTYRPIRRRLPVAADAGNRSQR